MNILITGGTVFVSRYTSEYFTNKGHTVYVLNRNTRPQSEGVHLIECDRHKIENRLKDIFFDLVIDVTSYNKEDVSDLLNGLGEFGEYIMISSSAVYPETLPQPFSEYMKTGYNIHWEAYGTNKLEAEEFLLNNLPNAYIIRPPYLYGVMNNLYREAFVFECAERDLPFYIPNDGQMKLHFFDVCDLCRLIENVARIKPEFHIINCGNEETVEVTEWIRLCYGVLGKTPEIRYVSDKHEQKQYFPFRNYEYILDISRQKSLLTDLKPLKAGLKESYEWFRNNREKIVRKDYFRYINDNFT